MIFLQQSYFDDKSFQKYLRAMFVARFCSTAGFAGISCLFESKIRMPMEYFQAIRLIYMIVFPVRVQINVQEGV